MEVVYKCVSVVYAPAPELLSRPSWQVVQLLTRRVSFLQNEGKFTFIFAKNSFNVWFYIFHFKRQCADKFASSEARQLCPQRSG